MSGREWECEAFKIIFQLCNVLLASSNAKMGRRHTLIWLKFSSHHIKFDANDDNVFLSTEITLTNIEFKVENCETKILLVGWWDGGEVLIRDKRHEYPLNVFPSIIQSYVDVITTKS